MKNSMWWLSELLQLKGPGRNSPVVDRSFNSIMYLIRDLVWLSVVSTIHIFLTLFEKIVPKSEKEVAGQIVVITGAGNGLGRQLAIKFSKLDSTVVCLDINEIGNKETLEMLSGPGQHSMYKCDVGKPQELRDIADKIIDKYGRVDIVIHNAGLLLGNTIMSPDDDFFYRVININLLSSFWVVRAFLPSMKARRCGQFVFMSSLSAIISLANASAYSATKAGMIGLINGLIHEFRLSPETSNIKLTAVLPSYANTRPDEAHFVKSRFKPEVAMTPKEAARQIVIGIRREYERFVVPGIRTSYFIASLLKLLPSEVYNMWRETFHMDPEVPEGVPYVPPPKHLQTNGVK